MSGFGFGDLQLNQANNRSSIEIFYQNTRGLRTKLCGFKNNIESISADIIAITETGCNESIQDAEIVPPGYSIIRCDRTDGRKQGGAFLVATHRFELRRVKLPDDVNMDSCSFELVCATVHSKQRFLFLCCVVYIPPGSNESEYMLLFRIIEKFCVKYEQILVLGDFNLYSSNQNVILYFEYFLSFCELAQKNKVHNCNNRQLDLVLSTLSLGEVKVCGADTELVPIDAHHPPLFVELRLGAGTGTDGGGAVQGESSSTRITGMNTEWNFKKGDYYLLYSLIALADWSPIYNMREPEEALNYFYSTMGSVIDYCVPKKRTKPLNSRRYPEWYSAEIIGALKSKSRLHKLYKGSGSWKDYDNFSRCRALIKILIQEAQEQHQDRVQRHLMRNPKAFWDYIRTTKGTVNRKTITKDGIVLSNPECAEEFAKYFESVYSRDSAQLDVEAAAEAGGASSAWVHLPQLTLREVRAALMRLKPKRSAGPDGIPAFVVSDCSGVLEEPLTHIYNLCLDTSYFPERWKVTRVIPVHKGGAGTEVNGFRPVAILSTIAKVFESAIQRSLQEQVASQLSDAQHGFRPGRSTTSNLLSAMEYVVPKVDAGWQVDAAYFDYKKAFDLVDNDILLSKLAAVGCTPKFLRFFASYMRDRRQYVEYDGCKSQLYLTKSGVSQGSNLGPLEFIIMINDLPKVVENARCLLFADDLKLLMEIKGREDCVRLQQDVDRVVEWSRKNKLQFNVSKCQIITFGRSRLPHQGSYKVDGALMQRTDAVQDLGVRLNSELTFREHIVNVCKKAYRSLGFVIRRAEGFTNMKAITSLYNALIRSQLEFNSVIWAPHEAKYNLMLERIQNKFTRYLYMRLYGVYPSYPLMYPTLFVLGMVGYNKLEPRRELALANYIVRVLRGLISNPEVLQTLCLCVPNEYVRRRRQPRLLAVPRGRTNLLNKAPLTRTIHTLNRVADEIDIFTCFQSEFMRTTLFLLSS